MFAYDSCTNFSSGSLHSSSLFTATRCSAHAHFALVTVAVALRTFDARMAALVIGVVADVSSVFFLDEGSKNVLRGIG